jgi:hypothetical protein
VMSSRLPMGVATMYSVRGAIFSGLSGMAGV